MIWYLSHWLSCFCSSFGRHFSPTLTDLSSWRRVPPSKWFVFMRIRFPFIEQVMKAIIRNIIGIFLYFFKFISTHTKSNTSRKPFICHFWCNQLWVLSDLVVYLKLFCLIKIKESYKYLINVCILVIYDFNIVYDNINIFNDIYHYYV